MKKMKQLFSIAFLMLLSIAHSQGIMRIAFLEIGSKPVFNNQFIQGNNGGSYFNTRSIYNDDRVKEIIKTQKEQEFKKCDKATFLLADVNMLQASYPVEAGYTYRIFAVSDLPQGTSIFRAKNQAGKELVPEIRNKEIGSIFKFQISQLQLQDIIATQNQTIYLENGMMSDISIYYATTYLIFKKKT